jgi:SAM-dependent methyltransferase
MPSLTRKLRERVQPPAPVFRLLHPRKPRFECPICAYHGPFADFEHFAGRRWHAQCPRCGALERHRLQHLALARALGGLDTRSMRMLHFAPEKFFRARLAARFGRYETADIGMKGVDHRADIQNLPFLDATYDFVFASHVLEHVPDDRKAIAEIRRVLKPGGLAILPVPIVCEKTVEYPAPNPKESGHVRAPGVDYFQKYRAVFRRVDVFGSEDFPEINQPFVYEDRTRWPTADCPLRTPMPGARHSDYVPVCYA